MVTSTDSGLTPARADEAVRPAGVRWKAVSAACAGLVASSALVAGCGSAQDHTAGDSGVLGESSSSASPSDPAASQASSSATSTDSDVSYEDGSYSHKADYGPVNEDSIDVDLTVAQGDVTAVKVTPHSSTPISTGYQNDFVNAIDGVVVGKPLKDLKVDKVAGASWTSDAFNEVLDAVRAQAARQSS